ncbi:hypothetical protein H9651_08955 [Microbacterium sp. Sa4CUA7]|uniref:Uncharacterized protein n=1 Tax=Microbacterium pullorum TaxID=2762236 RepID=A0ABR8S2P4_9MICO|nr:hypothetical protein [Microbacterium pullorum]MBD7957766.1 hypothetical protein [Microbacterium pullorum]
MKRIDIAYGGNAYSIGNRDIDEMRAQIAATVAGDAPAFWLEVNYGEGQFRPTYLLISAATQLSLTPIAGDEETLPSP